MFYQYTLNEEGFIVEIQGSEFPFTERQLTHEQYLKLEELKRIKKTFLIKPEELE